MIAIRMAGLDSGSSWTAATVLDVPATGRPSLVPGGAQTWAVGHSQPLREPRPYMRKGPDGVAVPQTNADGTVRMRTHEHVTTLEEADDVADAIVKWLVAHETTHLMIERVDKVAPGASVGATTSMATAIKGSAEVWAIVYSKAKSAGISVVTKTRQEAYGIAIGGAQKGRGEKEEATLARDVDGWAGRVRGDVGRPEHERNAATCALAGVRLFRGEVAPKPSRRTRTRTGGPLTPEQLEARRKRKRGPSGAELKAARDRRRVAAGVGPDVSTCPRCGKPMKGHPRRLRGATKDVPMRCAPRE